MDRTRPDASVISAVEAAPSPEGVDDSEAVTISGSARDILLYLWRRPHSPVTVEGDPVAADTYVGLLEGLKELFKRNVDLVMISAVKNPYFLECIERSRTLLYAA